MLTLRLPSQARKPVMKFEPTEWLFVGFFTVISSFFVAMVWFLASQAPSFAISEWWVQCVQLIEVAFRMGYVGLWYVSWWASLCSVGWAGCKLILSLVKTRQLEAELAKTKRALPGSVVSCLRSQQIPESAIWYVPNQDPVACSVGLLHPRIVISQGLVARLSRAQLTAVLLHEWYHVQHRHGLWLWLCTGAAQAVIMWPALHDVLAQMRHQFEQAADAWVVKRQATEEHVMAALLKLRSSTLPSVLALPFASQTSPRQAAKWSSTRLAVSVVITVVMCVLLLTPRATSASTQAALSAEQVVAGECAQSQFASFAL